VLGASVTDANKREQKGRDDGYLRRQPFSFFTRWPQRQPFSLLNSSRTREQYANIEGPKMTQMVLNHPKTQIAQVL
jgi:hypothetical protein